MNNESSRGTPSGEIHPKSRLARCLDPDRHRKWRSKLLNSLSFQERQFHIINFLIYLSIFLSVVALISFGQTLNTTKQMYPMRFDPWSIHKVASVAVF
jgi:hypothetical protein